MKNWAFFDYKVTIFEFFQQRKYFTDFIVYPKNIIVTLEVIFLDP